ncbi:MAG: hypothetical protein U0521_29890 [Anaerolineae bacterium]
MFPIYIDDVVDMMITAARHPAAANQIFNCTPDPSPTWRDFVGCYACLAGHWRWLAIPPAPFYPPARLVAAGRAARQHGGRYAGSARVHPAHDHQDDQSARFARLDARRRPDVGIAACAPLREQGLLA